MPTYVYEAGEGETGCPTCNRGLEVLHGMDESGPKKCPRCGGKLRKRFAAPGLSLRRSEKATLSDANLKRHGFKTLHNEGEGKFRIT